MGSEERITGALELFNEKAVKLERMSFVKTMLEHKTGVTMKIEEKTGGSYLKS